MAYRQYWFTSLAQKLPIGKYKGQTIGDIIVKDRTYYNWLSSLPNVTIDSSITRQISWLDWLAN